MNDYKISDRSFASASIPELEDFRNDLRAQPDVIRWRRQCLGWMVYALVATLLLVKAVWERNP